MLLDFSLPEYTEKAKRQAGDIAQQFSTQTDFRDPANVAKLAAYYVKHGLVKLDIPNQDVETLCIAPRDEQVQILTRHFQQQSPALRSAPDYCKRKSGNIIDTQLMSLKHLSGSLIEEVQARYAVHHAQGKPVKFADITMEVLAQQLTGFLPVTPQR